MKRNVIKYIHTIEGYDGEWKYIDDVIKTLETVKKKASKEGVEVIQVEITDRVCFFVERPESDEELKERLNREEKHKEDARQYRYSQYLELKKEFEKEIL